MTSNKEVQRPAPAKRLNWRATAAWVLLASIVLWLFIVGFPAWYAQVARVCGTADCIFSQLPEASARALADLGVPLWVYAGYMGALLLLDALAFLIASAVIFLQRAQSRMAAFVSFMLVLAPLTVFFTVPEEVAAAHPFWHVPVRLLHAAGIWSLIVFSQTFPDGRFVPHWSRLLAWVAVPVLGIIFLSNALSDLAAPTTFSERLLAVTLFAGIGSSIAFQVYRYRHEANAVERQQMKWVAAGFALFIAVGVTLVLAFILFPQVRTPGLLNGFYFLLGGTIINLVLILFVLSFAITILRYRLWDIDFIIRRTLVYTILTATLGLIYLASVILLQGLLRHLFGQESPVAIVLSTLLIAAIFTPLRRRLQDVIDRRFYRRKYDAVKTLATFGATARDEVNLEILVSALMQVVEDTMQPAHLSLWLAPSSDKVSNRMRLLRKRRH
jgi:hypothetical protein